MFLFSSNACDSSWCACKPFQRQHATLHCQPPLHLGSPAERLHKGSERETRQWSGQDLGGRDRGQRDFRNRLEHGRSEEHTSELQSRLHLVCRLLLEKKKKKEW